MGVNNSVLEKGMATDSSIPGKSHEQRSPEGYSPWGPRDEHDLVTKQTTLIVPIRVMKFSTCKAVRRITGT